MKQTFLECFVPLDRITPAFPAGRCNHKGTNNQSAACLASNPMLLKPFDPEIPSRSRKLSNLVSCFFFIVNLPMFCQDFLHFLLIAQSFRQTGNEISVADAAGLNRTDCQRPLLDIADGLCFSYLLFIFLIKKLGRKPFAFYANPIRKILSCQKVPISF